MCVSRTTHSIRPNLIFLLFVFSFISEFLDLYKKTHNTFNVDDKNSVACHIYIIICLNIACGRNSLDWLSTTQMSLDLLLACVCVCFILNSISATLVSIVCVYTHSEDWVVHIYVHSYHHHVMVHIYIVNWYKLCQFNDLWAARAIARYVSQLSQVFGGMKIDENMHLIYTIIYTTLNSWSSNECKCKCKH